MRCGRVFVAALGLGLLAGLAVGAATAPPPAGAAMRALGPGLWRAEVGDFTRLVAAVAFDVNDIWAAGDGIVHFDGSGWKQTLPGKRPFFRAIDGLSSRQLWAAGAIQADWCDSYGALYRFDGVSWHPETVETHVPLYGLDMVTATDGWAVGGSDQAVIVRYDGTAWRLQVAPEVAGLRAVYAVSPDDVWAVGDRGAIAHFDGNYWRAVDGPRFAFLTDVHFLDKDFGWAVGVDANMPSAVAMVYRDGQWRLDSFEEMPELYSVKVLAPTVTVAVGRAGVIMVNDGQTWREIGRTNPGGFVPWARRVTPATDADTAATAATPLGHPTGTPTAAPAIAMDVPGAGGTASATGRAGTARPAGDVPPHQQWAPQALHSVVVLPDRETMIAVGYAGQVIRIEDTLQWTELHSGHDLYAIDMLAADYGWIVGAGGRPLQWDGAAWTAPTAPSTARWVRDVDVVARDDVWAVGRRGTVLHWDGQAWTALPRFTWLDLQAVAFAAPDDGWVVASAFEDESMPWDSAQETYVYHWDGQSWQQEIRLCNTWLSDIAIVGPRDVWFADPGQPSVLHYNGQDWAWHPIWGQPRADGPAPSITGFAVAPDGTVWGSGYSYFGYGSGALARLEHGIWHALPFREEDMGIGSLAGATSDGVWGYRWDNTLVHVTTGGVTEVLQTDNEVSGLAVVTDRTGVPDVWMIGPASTVLHYRAPSASQLAPLVTVTAALPAPILYPTPTPYSVYDHDEALERISGLVDPDGTGETRLDSLDLVSMATWQKSFMPDFLNIPPDEGGDSPWFWDQHGTLDPCERGADLPVWVAEFSAAPRCPSHEFVVLDGTGRDAWLLACYPRRVDTLFLPVLLRPRDPGVEPTATATPYTRNLTPEPVVDIQGACPTSTPWPDEPVAGPEPARPGP
jgi:hypothetical protein